MEQSKIILLFIFLVALFILIHTYYYLLQIESCECFEKNGDYSVDIEFMKFYQLLEIITLCIFVGFTFLFKSKKMNIPVLSMYISTLSMVLVLGISIYMSINVFNFYKNIKRDCKCVNSWYKYFIYFVFCDFFLNLIHREKKLEQHVESESH